MVSSFCDALEASRRPLGEWLGQEDKEAWHATWGPWGRRDEVVPGEKKPKRKPRVQALSQHIEEVPKAMGALPLSPSPSGPSAFSIPQSGWLLFGAAFRGRIQDLTEHGITEPGERHDAALKLCWHWGKCRGFDKAATLARVREWLTSFEHASATRDRSHHAFVRDTMREVSHYYDRHVAPSGRVGQPRGADLALRPLPEVDKAAVLPEVDGDVRETAAGILRFLRNSADVEGRVPHPVNLSGKVLAAVLGERRVQVIEADGTVRRRRATVIAIEELERLGIVALHTDYSTGHHGRLYTCWYQFGSGALPRREDGKLVLAERVVEEGHLRVMGDGAGRVAVDLVPARSAVPSSSPWWVRMYQRRAFTPAEFFEGDDRKVIPGPFRHRRDRGGVSEEKSVKSAAPVEAISALGTQSKAGADPRPHSAPAKDVAPPGNRTSIAADPPPSKDSLEEQISRTWQAWLSKRKE